MRRVRHSLLAAVLVWTCCFLQGAGALHEMLSVHRVCAEHGELVDVHGSASADAGTSVVAVFATAAAGDSKHEHCSLAARHVPAVGGASPLLCGAVVPPAPAAMFRAAPRAPSVALLRLAPKAFPSVA